MAKLPPLYFSREQFADYWTSLLSRIRQDDECEQVYTGIVQHPIIALQQQNQQQITDYHITLVAEAVLNADPIAPADRLLASIQVAAAATGARDPAARADEDRPMHTRDEEQNGDESQAEAVEKEHPDVAVEPGVLLVVAPLAAHVGPAVGRRVLCEVVRPQRVGHPEQPLRRELAREDEAVAIAGEAISRQLDEHGDREDGGGVTTR